MGSSSYTPRHGSPRSGRRGVSKLVTAVRRPVVGGALAVGMVGTAGATVAFGDPSHLDTASAAISSSSSSSETSQARADDATTADAASLAEDRRETNVSRSGAREQERREDAKAEKAAERKKAERKRAEQDKKAKAERAAKAEREEEQRENDEKPVSERDFTREQLAEVRKDPKPYAVELMRERGWGDEEWGCLDQLWIGESDWEWDATNSSSGAYGIPQSLPATKMATAGSDWKTNPITQMSWGLEYIEQSYGSPCEAKEFWDSKDPHWY